MNFNALDDPWILVRWKDGRVSEVGIREALERASEIAELADPSPLVVTVQLRLLLALLYRIVTEYEWETVWEAKQLPADKLTAYFDQWRDRFLLFGERPFLQYPGLTTDKPGPLSKMAPEMVSGNNATLFDHNEDDSGTAYRPADALRMLLVGHAYGLGGLLKAKGTIDGAAFTHPSATDAVIARGVSLHLAGESLFETLLLNLAPTKNPSANDAPAWERDLTPAFFARAVPDGLMDRYTYLSRMIRLIPETDADGATVVRRMYYTQGRAIDKAVPDPMQCYREIKKGGMAPLLLTEGKATWRDLTALLQVNEARGIRAQALNFVGGLVRDKVVPYNRLLHLHVTGMASDKAKVSLWRHEQVNLPAAFLESEERVAELSNRLQAADDTVGLLWKRVRTLCWHFLCPVKEGMSPDPKNVSALADQIDPRRTYWARLENHLPELLERTARDDGDAAGWWEDRANEAAGEALASAIERLGPSPRRWRAAAAVSPYFGKRKEKDSDSDSDNDGGE
jgi:CRISPR system Cascade subunit CasA